MILKLSTISPLLSVVIVLQLSGCGNKGDLFLVPDEITQQDLLRLEQALETETVPANGADTLEEDEDELKKDKIENATSS
jgi:predicted small lipoprotein YifL